MRFEQRIFFYFLKSKEPTSGLAFEFTYLQHFYVQFSDWTDSIVAFEFAGFNTSLAASTFILAYLYVESPGHIKDE